MHCNWPHELDADWPRFLSAARRRSSAEWKVLLILFLFFSVIFISWIIKDIRKAPHRRLEIKKVSERAVLTHPDQLATHILKTTTIGEDLSVTRLTCNSGINFRNRYGCWSQWPIQCIQLWSQFLLVWIWISWKSIHHRMSVLNGWVLSLKIQFLPSIRVNKTSTRLSSHFYSAFRLLKRKKRKKKRVNNFEGF